jgi:uncharacterized OB-fold protein
MCFVKKEEGTAPVINYTINPLYPTGWVCPKCNKIFSPSTTECWYCNNPLYNNVDFGSGNVSGS